MRFCSTSAVFLAVAVLNAAMVSSSSADTITNGNFATGDYTGWTLGGDSSGDYIISGQLTGSDDQAALTTNGDDNGTLSQDIPTTAGQAYQFSYLLGGDGATPNSFSASLGGTPLTSLTDIGDTIPAGTEYSYSYTAVASSTILQFTDDDAPGYLYLTNVSLTAVTPAAVPLPNSVAMSGVILSGVVVLPLLRRRRA